MRRSSEILLRPLVTEKATRLTERLNRYGFVVARDANRLEVARAVEEFYGVTVLSVNTMNFLGKTRRRFTRRAVLRGRTDAYKKAIVTLKAGDSIDFYSNI